MGLSAKLPPEPGDLCYTGKSFPAHVGKQIPYFAPFAKDWPVLMLALLLLVL